MDDITIMGLRNTKMQKFINMLNNTFSLKDIGALYFFLGIEMNNLTNGDVLLK